MLASMIGGSVFDPRRIPGLEAWWDAADSANVTLDSGRVSQWNDKSGNGRHAANTSSGSTQPDYITAATNGLNAVRFARASSQRLVVGSSTSTFRFMHSEPATVFAVALAGSSLEGTIGTLLANTNLGTSNIGYSLFYNDASTNNNMIDLFITNGTASQNVVRARIDNSFSQSTYTLYSAITRPAESTQAARGEIRKNAGADGATHLNSTAALSTSNATSDLTIGAAANLALFWGGDICELLVYKADMATAMRQTIERYLMRKWGIT